MDEYINIIKDIIKNRGVRSSPNRYRTFGKEIQFDVKNGIIPVFVTSIFVAPRVDIDKILDELLWNIKGSGKIQDLPEHSRLDMEQIAVNEASIDQFIKKTVGDIEDKSVLSEIKSSLMNDYLGSIGPIYGRIWRDNPLSMTTSLLPLNDLDILDIPSDKRKLYSEEYDELVFFNKLNHFSLESLNGEKVDKLPNRDTYIKTRYLSSYDQLGEIVRNIKHDPYSDSHVLSVWIPQNLPLVKNFSAQENVLIGRGSLIPVYISIQFYVEKATDNGPDYLYMKVNYRSCDFPIGFTSSVVSMSLLLHLIAHCVYLRPCKLIWSCGECYIKENDIDLVNKKLEYTDRSDINIIIDNNKRDLFSLSRDDIKFIY